MKALITAGRSNKLRPLTYNKNKHLIELANKPMLFYALEKVVSAGITDIGVIIAEGDREIPAAVEAFTRKLETKVIFIEQHGGLRGIAHAIQQAQNFLGNEPFMLYLGDNIINDDIAKLRERFETSGANCLLTISKVSKPERFGVPEFDSMGRIVRVEERPIQPKSPYAVAGLYFYDANVHKAYPYLKPSFRGDYEISDLHTWLAQNGYDIQHAEITEWWKDRGTAEDMLVGNAMALKNIENKNYGSIEQSVRLESTVQIGAGTKIGGNTLIRGPVAIGEYCLIKDSYIGPNTSIGNKVELHGAEIENSIVYEEVSITATKKIADSIIGENSVISNADHEKPKGIRLIIGDSSAISI